MSRLPGIARWLLRSSPVSSDRRDEVESDLLELFDARRAARGAVHAHWRLYRDLASLWSQRREVTPDAPRRGLAASTLALLRDARLDLRYAVRLFARQPAIFLLTIVGLSLGLGIATAAFSITNAVLRGEGLVDPDRVPGVLRVTDQSLATTWRYDEFVRLREGATRLQVEAVLTDAATVRTDRVESAAPSIHVAFVSGGFFSATGGRATLGRLLAPADEGRVGPPPVVVSHAFWTSRLNADRDVVGRTIWVGRTPGTVVGVAARGFAVPNNRLLWMPITAYGSVYGGDASAARTPDAGVQVFGRLLTGASLAEAEAQLSGVAASLPRGAAAGDSNVRVSLDVHAGLGRMSASEALAAAVFVFGVILLVLVLSCANVATVLISSAITRDREMGVRAALGASRPRIVRQLVTESLALGAIAAAIGLLCASWAIPVVGRMIEAPAGTDLAPDLRVYVFLGVATVLTAVAAGMAPFWHGRGADLVTPLKGDGGRANRVAPRRLRSLLVMTQAAAGVLLIVMATLFVRASARAATIDTGFDAEGLYAVSPGLGDPFNDEGAASRVKAFWVRATAEVQAVPGVSSAALAELTPFSGLTKSSTHGEGATQVVTHFNRTAPEYFATVGMRLVAGRTFTRDEIAASAPVVLVSRALANAYWHGTSPLGELLPLEIPVPDTDASPARRVVIGVVADAITARLEERNVFAVYEPLGPDTERFAQLLVRVAPGTVGVTDRVNQRLRSIDPRAEVQITSIAARLQEEAGRPRMLATLTGVVGFVAIVLCVVGLYGLTASLVGQRTREMGIRAALGANSGDLLRLLMWDSLRPVVVGLTLGAMTALAISRVVATTLLFGVSPQDPLAFAGAATILLAAATLAVIVPTRRGSSVDAAVVLRQ